MKTFKTLNKRTPTTKVVFKFTKKINKIENCRLSAKYTKQ